jgi:hypothetical protein
LPFPIISSAFPEPCVLGGTFEERIKDCTQVKSHFAQIADSEKDAEKDIGILNPKSFGEVEWPLPIISAISKQRKGTGRLLLNCLGITLILKFG